MDQLIVVYYSVAQQIARLEKRDGMSREEAERIVSAQLPLEEKLKVADRVIPNEGSIGETRRKARDIFRELKRAALQKEN
jgi:dephospho-CoA kinase